jgi:hypothetical protein
MVRISIVKNVSPVSDGRALLCIGLSGLGVPQHGIDGKNDVLFVLWVKVQYVIDPFQHLLVLNVIVGFADQVVHRNS